MDKTWKPSIALIGLSGSGKSTVARMLCAQLGWFWIDTDVVIVERASRSIADIFGDEGESHFRALETSVLQESLSTPPEQPGVIATGGGIVLREENRKLLLDNAYIVWLDAANHVLLARLRAHPEQRPLLIGDNPEARLQAQRTARQHIYQSLADQKVDTTETGLHEAAEVIITGYKAFVVAQQQHMQRGLKRSEVGES